eukprot:12157314-Alexandrium_andersonii.AAC.1
MALSTLPDSRQADDGARAIFCSGGTRWYRHVARLVGAEQIGRWGPVVESAGSVASGRPPSAVEVWGPA